MSDFQPPAVLLQSQSKTYAVSTIDETIYFGSRKGQHQFETMVFALTEDGTKTDFSDVECRRAYDKVTAQLNHIELCREYDVNPENPWKH